MIAALFNDYLAGQDIKLEKLDVDGQNILVPVTLLLNKVTELKTTNWEQDFAKRLLEVSNSLICLYDITGLIEGNQQDDFLLNFLLENHDYLLGNSEVCDLAEGRINIKRPSE